MPDIVTMVDGLGRRRIVPGGPSGRFRSEGPGPASRCPRSVLEAIGRGLRGSCPSCGEAKLFDRFLQPVPTCPACGQDWRTRTADDFPPYLVILAVGHIIAPGMIALESGWHPPLWVHLTLWLPLVVLLAVVLIQPLKGAVLAVQWWHWDYRAAGQADTMASDGSSAADAAHPRVVAAAARERPIADVLQDERGCSGSD